MDYLKQFQGQAKILVFLSLAVSNGFIVGLWYISAYFTDVSSVALIIIYGSLIFLFNWLMADVIISRITAPLKLVRQAVHHVSEGASASSPPNLQRVWLGRELLTHLVPQIYKLASGERDDDSPLQVSGVSETVLYTLPLALVVINNQEEIEYINQSAAKIFDTPSDAVAGKNVHESLRMQFATKITFEAWLNMCRKKRVTSTKTWHHVRITNTDGNVTHQGDVVAYYNKGLGKRIETTLAFFDRSEDYASDDEGISFMALAVHELRTPITIMRGYIEVFEEELGDKLDGEQTAYMQKLSASAQQLTSFVSNILNVARIEENQLMLHLEEQKWSEVVHAAINDISIRAEAHAKHIDLNIHTGLPTVAVDRMSIYEVLANLIDNAVKYSGDSDRIVVSSRLMKDGSVETTVQDFGRGIDGSVLKHVFEKFYRNHRSKNAIGGTGLGLFLCKEIIEAHGGHIWVRSKEGEGSTFGFTVQNYQAVASNNLGGDNSKGITRNAHGWIKNHSMYRE